MNIKLLNQKNFSLLVFGGFVSILGSFAGVLQIGPV